MPCCAARAVPGGGAAQQFGALLFDRDARRATLDGAPIELSPREWMLLDLLLTQRDRVVTKDQIAESWAVERSGSGGGSIEVYIHRLRRKLRRLGPGDPHRARPGLSARREGEPASVHEALHRVLHRLPGVTPGGSSLHRHLLLWLLLPQLVLIGRRLFTYNLTARYANQAIDAGAVPASRRWRARSSRSATACSSTSPRRAGHHRGRPGRPRLLHGEHAAGQFILGNHRLPPPAADRRAGAGPALLLRRAMGRADAAARCASPRWPSSYGEADRRRPCWCRWRAAASAASSSRGASCSTPRCRCRW